MLYLHSSAVKLLVLMVISSSLAACSGLPSLTGQQTATTTPLAEIQPTSEATETGDTSDGPITLSVWLPPRFDPTTGSQAATMLQNRLDDFSEMHTGVRVDVRLKSENGSGGLLDFLLAAQAAAPLAMPDLVLLPSGQVAKAVEGDLLRTLDDLLSQTFDEDWYGYGLEMVTVAEDLYGIPFAGDALIVINRPSAIERVPGSWDQAFSALAALSFAAAEPEARFSFSQILSGSETTGSDGMPEISQEQYDTYFSLLADGQASGVFPFWLSQFETREQSWTAFLEGRTPMAVAWSSQFLQGSAPDHSAAPLPSYDGEHFTLARGWIWGVTSITSERSQIAAELAEFLSAPEFLAQWSAAAGYLPPRASSLAAWSPDERQALASQVLGGTVALFPRDEALLEIGTSITEAVVAILKQEITPEEASQKVINSLESP